MFDDTDIQNYDCLLGSRLVDYKRVGLPVYLASIDVLSEERCELHLIEEYILRFIAAGVSRADELVGLMGVSHAVVHTTLADLYSQAAITVDDELVSISNVGREKLSIRGDMRCKEDLWFIPFDGILRAPYPWDHRKLLTGGELREQGHSMEIGPFGQKPEAVDLDTNAVYSVLQSMRPGRDLDRLLEIRNVRRAPLRFMPAIQLAYVGVKDQLLTILLVDGRKLEAHSNVFVEKGGLSRPAFRELRGERSSSASERSRVRRRLGRSQSESVTGVTDDTKGSEAHQVFDVPIYCMQKHLFEGLELSTNRLVITSRMSSVFVMNDRFFVLVVRALERGVAVFIGLGSGSAILSVDETRLLRELARVKSLSDKFPNLKIWSIKEFTHSHLIVDDRLVVVGQYDWLMPDGSAERFFRERWFLGSTISNVVDKEAARVLQSV